MLPPLTTDALSLASIGLVYITGPIQRGERAFVRAARAIRDRGVGVLSPHEKDEHLSTREALEWDVKALLLSDAVVVLREWEQRPECVFEAQVAESLGKPVVTLDTLLDL